ncbi:hypothetical protein [Helicobacter cappadocius]|uniref:Uncharacterized protein n=1 Tax=Helicobacter cappadocius TaxID=3063998 RepID=A0AA90T5K7_9HELI|nr:MULTISPECIES: hypothetical protein [unclassified Helicobacter]MDO7253615.1 hypothetical protein [Helicobacter sp. faydin-H75]MDP2539543.1 hypothetical protein [Helicobacter sp. faydin-H76]
MDIQNNFSGLRDIFQGRYSTNISSSAPVNESKHSSIADELQNRDIKDSFTPSLEYSKILDAKDIVKGGLKDVDSFISMTQTLKKENILNSDDMIAVDFLAKESPKLDFDAFNKIIKNDNLSMEMKGLITTLVQKIEMIDYLSGGVMAA